MALVGNALWIDRKTLWKLFRTATRLEEKISGSDEFLDAKLDLPGGAWTIADDGLVCGHRRTLAGFDHLYYWWPLGDLSGDFPYSVRVRSGGPTGPDDHPCAGSPGGVPLLPGAHSRVICRVHLLSGGESATGGKGYGLHLL